MNFHLTIIDAARTAINLRQLDNAIIKLLTRLSPYRVQEVETIEFNCNECDYDIITKPKPTKTKTCESFYSTPTSLFVRRPASITILDSYTKYLTTATVVSRPIVVKTGRLPIHSTTIPTLSIFYRLRSNTDVAFVIELDCSQFVITAMYFTSDATKQVNDAAIQAQIEEFIDTLIQLGVMDATTKNASQRKSNSKKSDTITKTKSIAQNVDGILKFQTKTKTET